MPIRPRGETGETCLSLREVVLCVCTPTPQPHRKKQPGKASPSTWGGGAPGGGRTDGPSWVGGRPRGIRHLPHLWDPCGHVGAVPLMGGVLLSSGKVWTHLCLMGGDLGLLNE